MQGPQVSTKVPRGKEAARVHWGRDQATQGLPIARAQLDGPLMVQA